MSAQPAISTQSQCEPTPGPWGYVASTEHHGPYVVGPFGGDICDCYTMSNLRDLSVRNGGTSCPVHFMGEQADANAAFIVRACNSHPELVEALRQMLHMHGKPHREEWLNDAGFEQAKQVDALARAALSKATGGAE